MALVYTKILKGMLDLASDGQPVVYKYSALIYPPTEHKVTKAIVVPWMSS